ncbi:MAG: hypothetical protein M3O82_02290 [Verrucomicrobiota bacterium]|nr:hypothetical protein [Verrucomicrobiota bacterium]
MVTIIEEMEAIAPSVRSRLFLAGSAVGLATAAFFLSQNTPAFSLASKKESSPPASLLPSDSAETEAAIRFYKKRVEGDPEDTRSQNALAEYYLKRVHESGNEDYLPLALEAARASLAAVVAERNIGGLIALVHAEFANHDFALARDHALQLIKLDPGKASRTRFLAMRNWNSATTTKRRSLLRKWRNGVSSARELKCGWRGWP